VNFGGCNRVDCLNIRLVATPVYEFWRQGFLNLLINFLSVKDNLFLTGLLVLQIFENKIFIANLNFTK